MCRRLLPFAVNNHFVACVFARDGNIFFKQMQNLIRKVDFGCAPGSGLERVIIEETDGTK